MRATLFAVVLVASLALCSAATAPNTPADGSANADTMCLLRSLDFSNALNIYQTSTGTQGFASNVFHYTCSCAANYPGTVVIPRMFDQGSSAEITLNGQKMHFRSTHNAISNDGSATTQGAFDSPNTQSAFLPFTSGTNTLVIGVGCNGFANPDCYYQYTITCQHEAPPSGGFVTGDPQFVGLRGQNYQVHGVSGEIYNIVSDADLQYNSRFVFLNSGKCPVVDGRKQKACWSHPGSYLGELGLKTRAGDRIHLVSGSAASGFAEVTVNGKELALGDSVLLADGLGSVSRNTTHLAAVSIGNWDFAFENSDMFVNQRVRVLDARSLRSHGLLGQTWREATYPNAVKFIAGEVDDYVIRDADIFGDNFVFNAFN